MIPVVLILGGVFFFTSKGAHGTTGTITYLNQTLSYTRAGSGSTVILIPGLHRGRAEYDQLAALLTSHDVITYDLLGQGQSSCIDIAYSYDTQVEFLNALITQLGVTTPHLVGFSEGAPIAARWATQNPTKVKSLTLISAQDVEFTDASGNAINVLTAAAGSAGRTYRRTLPATSISEGVEALKILYSAATSPLVTTDNGKKLFLNNLNGGCWYGGRMGDKQRVLTWYTKAEGATLSAAAVPTELLWGDKNQILNPAYQAAWKTAIPSATVVPIAPNCGHDAINECPAAVATALEAYFAAHGG